MASLLMEYLQQQGFEVQVAYDAYMGFQAAIKSRPDLIVLDMLMPAGGGGSLYEKLRKNINTASTPVVFITGLKPEQAKKRLPRDAGRFILLSKPVDVKLLGNKITSLLSP